MTSYTYLILPGSDQCGLVEAGELHLPVGIGIFLDKWGNSEETDYLENCRRERERGGPGKCTLVS